MWQLNERIPSINLRNTKGGFMELTTLLGIIIGILVLIFITLALIYFQLEYMANRPDAIAYHRLDETIEEIKDDVKDIKENVVDINMSK